MSNYFVVNDPAGGWNVKLPHAQRASFHAENQKEAELQAKEFSANSGGGEVRIQDTHGKWRDSDTVPPGRDPYPPRDIKH